MPTDAPAKPDRSALEPGTKKPMADRMERAAASVHQQVMSAHGASLDAKSIVARSRAVIAETTVLLNETRVTAPRKFGALGASEDDADFDAAVKRIARTTPERQDNR